MRFIKRLAALVAATALALSASLTTPAPAAASHPCYLGTTGNYLQWVEKWATSYFDIVRGDITVRQLATCAPGSVVPEAYGTFVLPANIQSTTSDYAHQLGYGYRADNPSTPIFVYASGDPPYMNVIPGLTPIVGHRYRFEIIRDANGHPDFYIKNLTAGYTLWAYTSSGAGWGTSFKRAWWGFETFDTASQLGTPGGPTVDMAYMGYSYINNSSIYYRSGMVESGDVWSVPNIGDLMHTPDPSIGTWVYGGDMFNVVSY